MDKAHAIKLLGGSVKKAAAAIGITEEAIYTWPDPLPPRIRDRVQAALWRAQQAVPISPNEPMHHIDAPSTVH